MDERNIEAESRRAFLKRSGLLGAGLGLAEQALEPQAAAAPAPQSDSGSGGIPRRPLGKTGVQTSILAIGGHHLGDAPDLQTAMQIVQEALDAGVTFFDNCWEYHNGRSEDWLGRALKGRRDRALVMTKVCTHGRDKKLAMQMLEESLKRLQTDHLDVWQVHGVSFDNDPDLAFAKGGVIEALDQAKKEGKVRFVGFSGHKDPAIHLKMLAHGYHFDTVQMPLNACDSSFRSFEKQVLPELNRRGIAPLGMKSLGGTAAMVKMGAVTAEEALHYAMSLPVATTITGVDKIEVLHQNLKIARGFTPMTDAEMQSLRTRCANYAADGRYELYKVSLKFDNPEARKPHFFPLDMQQKEVKEMFSDALGQPQPK